MSTDQPVTGALRLVCVKCTREAVIPASDRGAALRKAIRLGWVSDQGNAVCPNCPAVRR
jgi:hypothetical protein